MKKRIFLLIVILVIAAIMPIASFADIEDISNERMFSRLVDDANLLTEEEESRLLIKLDEISQRQGLDIVIITIDSLEGFDVVEYADYLFDEFYGMSSDFDGILFLLSMEERDWAISTYGYGETAFTDSGQEFIMNSIKKDLSKDNYNRAFNRYAEFCDDFITKAKTDKPYGPGNLPKKSLSPMWILFSLMGGAIIALIVTGVMKGSLKTVSMQAAAESYVKQDSMNIVSSQDLFLYDVIDKIAKPKKEEFSGSGTHTSSSGRTHGGSSGKF